MRPRFLTRSLNCGPTGDDKSLSLLVVSTLSNDVYAHRDHFRGQCVTLEPATGLLRHAKDR